MRIPVSCICVVILSIAASEPGIARERSDAVSLKSGSVINGRIIEISPEGTLRLETSDGSILAFRMAEIQKISRECARSTPQESAGKDSAEGTEPLQCRYALTGGIALPTGDFGSVMSGAAKPGFTLGAEFELRFSRNVGWVTQFNFSDNPFDEQAVHDVLTGFMGGGYDIGLSLNAKPWLSYLCVTGLKASAPLSPGFTVFCTGAMGVFIGTAPEITVSTYFGSFTQESATASAFAYSISVGFVIGDIFRCDAKYLSATPKYSQNSGDPVEQPTSIVLVEVGVEF